MNANDYSYISETYDIIKKNLKSDFLDSKTLEKRNQILEKSEHVTRHLVELQNQSLIRAIRIIPISLVVSGSAPFCSVDSLRLAVEVGLWLFGLDDIFDEKIFDTKNLLHRIRIYRDIIHGHLDKKHLDAKDHNDELAKILNDFCTGLHNYQLYDQLKSEWVYSASRIIDSMIEEHRWQLLVKSKGAEGLPNFNDYIEFTRYSAGVPAYIWAMLIVLDDRSIPHHLPYLSKMESLASMSIRLSNDIQSAEREAQEGKEINALTIYTHELQKYRLSPEAARQEAKKIIESSIEYELAELNRLAQNPQTATGLAESVIADIARFTCEFYKNYDFHTFSHLIQKH